MNGANDAGDVSGLLRAWSDGQLEARDRVMELVYHELRRRAATHLRRERAGHTLQPTALVHETYLRLIEQKTVAWQNRAQFFGVASRMMRRILVDRARARKTTKRSGNWARVTLEASLAHGEPSDVDVLDLHAALTELAAFDARKSQVAELRFFGVLTLEPGSSIGVYRVEALLGVGGMGEVFRAHDSTLGHVAIKVLPQPFASDAERVDRLRREARVLAALNHPAIVAAPAVHPDSGEIYFVVQHPKTEREYLSFVYRLSPAGNMLIASDGTLDVSTPAGMVHA